MSTSGSTHLRPKPRVIGVDPGKLTGLALLHGESLTRVAVPLTQVEDVLRVWLASETLTDVAIERFVITRNTARKTQQLDAIKVSGIVENLVMHIDYHRVVYQNMSDAKRFGNPALMKALGWWETGKHSSHKNDATSQVLKLLADRHPNWIHLHVTPDII
jgi:hypothetical protein